jgi:hypothetical protein
MVIWMKTTIDISDAIFRETKALAQSQKLSFKNIVETALRNLLADRQKAQPGFRLKKHSFNGEGLVDDLLEGDWNRIRERAYEGHGG